MVSIIGAGPAGSATGFLLAKAGYDVNIYEEHKYVGEPVQCTGIVTSDFKKLVQIKPEFLINKIKNARIYSPCGNNLEISFKRPNIIIDRWAFDNHLADKAESAGAKLHLDSKFLRMDGKRAIIKQKNKLTKRINDKIIIGADGPSSSVAKSAKIFGNREFLAGAQAIVKIENDNAIEFYPYIGTFGWVVPENERTARVGILARRNTAEAFKKLLKLKSISENDIIEKQGGVVPIYNNSIRTYTKYGDQSIYLVGDAATQVKATTGGGIVQGLIAARTLADSIIHNRDYEKEWKHKIGRDLWLHLKARKVMDKFSYKDWNKLIDIFNTKKNREVLGMIERDNPSKLFLKLALQEPRLWQFARKII